MQIDTRVEYGQPYSNEDEGVARCEVVGLPNKHDILIHFTTTMVICTS